MAAKKLPAKKQPTPPAPKRGMTRSGGRTTTAITGDMNAPQATKLGSRAYENASKRGTLVGPTTVRLGSSNKKETHSVYTSSTDIKSKRGNLYTITESKRIVPLGRDSKTKTTITPTKKKK